MKNNKSLEAVRESYTLEKNNRLYKYIENLEETVIRTYF